MRFGQAAMWLILAAGLCTGCDPLAGLTRYERLQHEDPTVRAEATVRAAEQNDREAIPYIVDRLTDSEQGVRWAAICALEKMTGETFGYQHYGPAAERAEAVARWRKWLEAGRPQPPRGEAPATAPAGPATTQASGENGR